MTKVFVTEEILDYRRGIAELVRKVVQENYVGGVKTFQSKDVFSARPDMLPSPRIELIELGGYKGQIGDPIFLATSDDFGMARIHIVIKDDQGNLIESGEADQFQEDSDCWDYRAKVPVPSGTSVIVYAAATDILWGVGALSAHRVIP